MAQAPLNVFGRQVIAAIQPTKIGEMSFVEGVAIPNFSLISENPIVAANDLINLFLGQHYPVKTVRESSGWEQRNIGSGNVRDISKGGDCRFCILRNDGLTEFREDEIVRGGRAVIFSEEVQSLFFFISEVFYGARDKPDIGAQLTVFGVLHDLNLFLAGHYLLPAGTELQCCRNEKASGQQRIETDSDSRANFDSKLPPFAIGVFLTVFGILFAKGYERLVYDGQFLSGASYMAVGWLTGLAAMWLLIMWLSGHFISPVSGNITAAPGIDASLHAATRFL